MIQLVVLAVIGLLKAYHTVQSVMGKLAIVLHFQRHHFDFDVREVTLGYIDGLGQIGHTGLGRILARYQQDILERSQLLNSLIFIFNLLRRKDGARHGVLAMESAIHTRVTA